MNKVVRHNGLEQDDEGALVYYSDYEALEQENKRYKAALEFYEEKENWYGDEENNINPPAIDEGERAREALEILISTTPHTNK